MNHAMLGVLLFVPAGRTESTVRRALQLSPTCFAMFIPAAQKPDPVDMFATGAIHCCPQLDLAISVSMQHRLQGAQRTLNIFILYPSRGAFMLTGGRQGTEDGAVFNGAVANFVQKALFAEDPLSRSIEEQGAPSTGLGLIARRRRKFRA